MPNQDSGDNMSRRYEIWRNWKSGYGTKESPKRRLLELYNEHAER